MNYSFHVIIIIASSSSDKVQEILCQHLSDILEDTQCKLESGEITVKMLLCLKNKWDTHLVQMLPALSMDQNKFLSNIQFANKRVYTFKLFLKLLKEFAFSFPISRFTTIIIIYLFVN